MVIRRTRPDTKELKDLNNYTGIFKLNVELFVIGFKNEYEFNVIKNYLNLDLEYKQENISLNSKQYVSDDELNTYQIKRLWFLDFFKEEVKEIVSEIKPVSRYISHNDEKIESMLYEGNYQESGKF
jgi:hypothetical protein